MHHHGNSRLPKLHPLTLPLPPLHLHFPTFSLPALPPFHTCPFPLLLPAFSLLPLPTFSLLPSPALSLIHSPAFTCLLPPSLACLLSPSLAYLLPPSLACFLPLPHLPSQEEREERLKDEKMRIGIEKMKLAHKKRVAIKVFNPDRSNKTGGYG